MLSFSVITIIVMFKYILATTLNVLAKLRKKKTSIDDSYQKKTKPNNI